jgi:hypothetical protein
MRVVLPMTFRRDGGRGAIGGTDAPLERRRAEDDFCESPDVRLSERVGADPAAAVPLGREHIAHQQRGTRVGIRVTPITALRPSMNSTSTG